MLESIWFVLWAVLWAVYFTLDGFDLGIGTLLTVFGKNEEQRKTVYHSMGPFWDGNEVWLVAAGGVTFAAFPRAYAVMFSSLYSPLMIILFALIIRGVAIAFREEHDGAAWKKMWDICLVVGSVIPAVFFGVAFANIFRGLPIGENGVYAGNLFSLLNLYGLAGGVLFLLLFTVHGSIWLRLKSEGELADRAASTASKLWTPLAVVAVIFLAATAFATGVYGNYIDMPPLFVIPIITVAALVAVKIFLKSASYWKAWFASAVTIFSATLFGVVGIYPNILPSSVENAYSVTIYNSASSPKTLKIMLGVVLVILPIVIIYQVWTYKLFKDKISEDDLAHGEGY